MPAHASEAIVLRTYPFREADLVVSFLSREQGKLRGVARRARRPKSAFGSGLERLSHVRMDYFQSETRELVSLHSCELVHSQFAVLTDYAACVALDYLAEVREDLLPPGEPSERFFRLLLAVLEHLRSGAPGAVWRAVTYFSLWAVRLAGFLPDLAHCAECRRALEPGASGWYSRWRHGLLCGDCRRALGGSSFELSAASRELAARMLRAPVAQMGPEVWSKDTARDLRRFLVQQIETHVERRLITAPVLEAV